MILIIRQIDNTVTHLSVSEKDLATTVQNLEGAGNVILETTTSEDLGRALARYRQGPDETENNYSFRR